MKRQSEAYHEIKYVKQSKTYHDKVKYIATKQSIFRSLLFTECEIPSNPNGLAKYIQQRDRN